MEKVKRVLEERRKYLLDVKEGKEKALLKVPEGDLRICCSDNRVRYYHTEKNRKQDIYLKKQELQLVRKLAQKDYDQKVLRAVEKELLGIEKCLNGYLLTGAEEVYGKLHKERRKLVVPIREADEEYVRHWEEVV